MYKTIIILIFVLFLTAETSLSSESDVYVQTLNMGSEEYFIEDTSVYPNSEINEASSTIQYIQNNYNYAPYTYPNYLYSRYGTYSITSPVYRSIYRPAYAQTKPCPCNTNKTQTKTTLPQKQRGAFAYKYN